MRDAMSQRRKYDAEFRDGVVTIVRETGKPIAEVARELGSVPARWGTGCTRTGWPTAMGLTTPGSTPRACVGLSGRTPSCGWSVMCSGAQSSCG